jgi:dienelactone hydrolase
MNPIRALFGGPVVIPGPSGEYAIGTTRFEVSEPGSVDTLAPTLSPRRVPVQAWYPAPRGVNGQLDPYLDGVLSAALAELTHMPKLVFKQRPSSSVLDAPAASGRFPVVIFNHGYGSFQKQSTSLLEELASHGYVVLSVGHPYESLVVQLADGAVVKYRRDLPAWRTIEAGLKDLETSAREVEPLLAKARAAKDPAALHEVMQAIAATSSYSALGPVLERWVQDTRVVLDHLGKLDTGALAPPLKGVVDGARVGVFGHSLGGMLAGQLAMTEPRVRAGMSFDGAQLPPPDGTWRLHAPFCFLYADTTKVGRAAITNEGMNDALLSEAPSGSCSAVLKKAAHLNFTDMNNRAMMAAALGDIDRGEMARLLRATTVGFFDHHLKSKPLSGFTPSATLRVCWPRPAAA